MPRPAALAALSLCTAVSLSALTGCGTQESKDGSGTGPAPVATSAEVVEALAAMGEKNQIAATFTADPQTAVEAALKAAASDSDPQGAAVAEALLEASYTVAVATDADSFSSLLSTDVDPWELDYQFKIDTATTLLDIVSVDQTLYAAADLDAVADVVGMDPGPLLSQYAAGTPAQAAVEALVAGDYVSLTRATVESATQGAGLGAEEFTAPDVDVAAEQAGRLADIFLAALETTAAVSAGEDGYTHVEVSPADYSAEVQRLVAADPELADVGAEEFDVTGAPETLTFDLAIAQGEVVGARIDVLQAASAEDLQALGLSATDEFDIVISLDDEYDIVAPTTNVVPVDEAVAAFTQAAPGLL